MTHNLLFLLSHKPFKNIKLPNMEIDYPQLADLRSVIFP